MAGDVLAAMAPVDAAACLSRLPRPENQAAILASMEAHEASVGAHYLPRSLALCSYGAASSAVHQMSLMLHALTTAGVKHQ